MRSLPLMLSWLLLIAPAGWGRRLQGPSPKLSLRESGSTTEKVPRIVSPIALCLMAMQGSGFAGWASLGGKSWACSMQGQQKHSRSLGVLLLGEPAAHETDNPLLVRKGLPLSRKIVAADFESAAKMLNQTLDDEWQKLQSEIAAGSTSSTDLIEALEKIEYPVSHTNNMIKLNLGLGGLYERSALDEHWPAICQVSDKYQSIMTSPILYDALAKLDFDTLSQSQQRIVAARLQRMRAEGVQFKDKDKEEYERQRLAIASNLTGLAAKFMENVEKSSKEFEIIVTNWLDVEGLPSFAREAAAESYAEAKGNAEAANPDAGPWRLTLENYVDIMKYLDEPEIREKLWRAQQAVATTGEFDNRPVIDAILKLRHKQAKLEGYDSYAEFAFSNHMAQDFAEVEDFMSQLLEKAKPSAERELADLGEFAKREGYPGELQPWDVMYWQARFCEELYDWKPEPQVWRRILMENLKFKTLDGELADEYLPLPKVLDALFGLASKLFGIQISREDGLQGQLWHPDVSVFRVVDEATKEVLGFQYLDPYPRPGKEFSGTAYDATVSQRSKVMGTKPATLMVLNVPPPSGDKPPLLTPEAAETLFHEFGHSLQSILTNVDESSVAGTFGIEDDIIEMPSIFMEKWVYHKPTFFSFAKHWETGDAISLGFFEQFRKEKKFFAGKRVVEELYKSELDLELHKQDFEASGESCVDIERRLAAKYPVNFLSLDNSLCRFEQLFDTGAYAANYYSYLWGEVYAAEAFDVFIKAGLDNDEALKAIGRRFRETVLGSGGSRPAAEVYRDFLGVDAANAEEASSARVKNFIRVNGLVGRRPRARRPVYR